MKDIKLVTLRIKKELWSFGKKKCVDREMSFNELINSLLMKYKIKCDKKIDNK